MFGYSAIFLISCFVGIVFALWLLKWLFGRGVNALRRRALMARYDHPEFVASIMDGRIMRGMSMDMVIDVWGDPADLDEIALKTKTKTEMKYDQKGKKPFWHPCASGRWHRCGLGNEIERLQFPRVSGNIFINVNSRRATCYFAPLP